MDPVTRLSETYTSRSVFSRFNKVSVVALAALAVGVALGATALFISMPVLFIPAAILTAIGGSILIVQCCFNRHVVSEDINELSSFDEGASDAYDMAYPSERAPPPTYQDSDDDSEMASTAKTSKVPVRLGDGLGAAAVPIPVPRAQPTTSPLVPFPIPTSSPSAFVSSLPLPNPAKYQSVDQIVNASFTTRPQEVIIGQTRTVNVNISENYHNGRRVDTASKQTQDQGYVFV